MSKASLYEEELINQGFVKKRQMPHFMSYLKSKDNGSCKVIIFHSKNSTAKFILSRGNGVLCGNIEEKLDAITDYTSK